MKRTLRCVVCAVDMLLIPGCSWGQAAVAKIEEGPTSAETRAKLKFELHQGYLVIVKGTLSAGIEGNFLLDTGAYPSVLDREIAVNLGLAEKPARVNLSQKTVRAQVVVLPLLMLGPLRVTGLPVLTEDMTFLSKAVGQRVDGIVGLDVFRKFSFRVDYAKKEIEFGAVDGFASCAVFETVAPLVSVGMKSQGRRFRVVIDTGGPDLMFFASRISGAVQFKEMGSEEARDSGGTFRRRKVMLADVHLGEETIGTQTGYVVEDKKDNGDNFDAVLGMRGSHFRRIAFDFERRRFCWDR
jgi:Aspartyl protease